MPGAFLCLLAYSAPMIDRTWRDRGRLGILVAVTFVLAHDVAFLLTYGSSWQALLARTGHGDGWTETVLVVAGLSVALAFAGAWRASPGWRGWPVASTRSVHSPRR